MKPTAKKLPYTPVAHEEAASSSKQTSPDSKKTPRGSVGLVAVGSQQVKKKQKKKEEQASEVKKEEEEKTECKEEVPEEEVKALLKDDYMVDFENGGPWTDGC